MSRGRRYNGEKKLNLTKVFAVFIALVVLIVAIISIKNIFSKRNKSDNTVATNYFALYKDEKWGILGSNGTTVVEPMYQEMPIIIDSSKDVFICTYDVDENTGTYKTKAINRNNEEIFTNYDNIEAVENYDSSSNVWYEENVLKVQKDGKWGLIDLDGKEILATEYDDIYALKGIKNSIIIKKGETLGLVNDKGLKIIDTSYKEITNYGDDYKKGYIVENTENKYGLISFSGDTILEAKYEKIDNIYGENYFVIEEGGKENLINSNGENVISNNFDKIMQIANSGIVYTKDNKYGFMDFDGNVKIEPKYTKLEEINDDVFEAQKDGKCGIIDINENEKISFAFKEINYISKASIYIAENEDYTSNIYDSNFEQKLVGIVSEINTDDGYLKIQIDGTYKYYNFKFEEKNIKDILTINNLFVSKKDGKYGFVDKNGNVVVDYIYDDATELNSYGYAGVKKDGLWGSIDSKGNVVIEPCYNLDDNLKIDFIGKWHLGMDLNMNYYCER